MRVIIIPMIKTIYLRSLIEQFLREGKPQIFPYIEDFFPLAQKQVSFPNSGSGPFVPLWCPKFCKIKIISFF